MLGFLALVASTVVAATAALGGDLAVALCSGSCQGLVRECLDFDLLRVQ